MKKIVLALVLVCGSLAYVFVNRATADTGSAPALVASVDTSNAATSVTDTSALQAAPAAAAPVTATKAATPVVTASVKTASPGQYTDGTYTGSVADAYYGNIQVAAVISGGRLSNVKVLTYPNDRGTSIEINQQALPMLIREAVSAQSANVNGISGASDTSAAFVESLGTALAAAKA